MTTTAEAVAQMDDVQTDTTTLDAMILLCNQRQNFDLKEIEKMVADLDDRGIKQPRITDPLLDWTRERIYTAATKVQDALLDIRNIIAPYPEIEV